MARVLWYELTYAALFACALFAPAGTWHWWRAWVLLAVLVVMRTVSTVTLLHINPRLLAERSKPPIQRGQPFTDRILLVSSMASFAALPMVSSLDVFRWHLLPSPPLWLSVAGLGLAVAGWWI